MSSPRLPTRVSRLSARALSTPRWRCAVPSMIFLLLPDYCPRLAVTKHHRAADTPLVLAPSPESKRVLHRPLVQRPGTGFPGFVAIHGDLGILCLLFPRPPRLSTQRQRYAVHLPRLGLRKE